MLTENFPPCGVAFSQSLLKKLIHAGPGWFMASAGIAMDQHAVLKQRAGRAGSPAWSCWVEWPTVCVQGVF